jgi:formylglycine-generating enzyme
MSLRATVLLWLMAAAAVAGPAKADGPHGHRLVMVAAGDYTVGQKGHAMNPLRTVALKACAIADAETTNAQFAAFVTATGYRTTAERRGSAQVFRYGQPEYRWPSEDGASWRLPFGKAGRPASSLPQHPVTQVSAIDAAAYCRWAGGRLPTQAEWETSARAGAKTLYPWGDEFDVRRANIWNGATHQRNTREDGWEFTSPVRSYAPNAWGLYDVCGNVFEYTSDLPPGVRTRRTAPLTSARGGSWWCSPSTCRFYNLVDAGTMQRSGSLPNQGFRIVFDLPLARGR